MFDPMIANHCEVIEAACHTMLDALREVQVAVCTNLELLERIVGSSNFQTGPQTDSSRAPRADVDAMEAFPCHDLALGSHGTAFALGSIPTSPWDVQTVSSTLGVTCCSGGLGR